LRPVGVFVCFSESALSIASSKSVHVKVSDFVIQNAGKLRDYYRIGKMLGSGKTHCFLQLLTNVVVFLSLGAFGEVRMCVHRDTGAQRAVKVLRKSHMDEDEKKMLFNEINILRHLVSTHSLSLHRDTLTSYLNIIYNF
jgi:serine/threonine protein kinase